MPELTIKLLGVVEVKEMLQRGMAGANNMKPALELVADEMMYALGKNWSSQGRRGGGSWAQLSESWALFKANAGLSPDILVATGALHDSMTQRDDPDQYLRITSRSVELSTYLPYGVFHTTGTRNMPQRDFTRLLASDRQQWVKICQDYLANAMKI
jgi:phage gpG-like protein